MGRRQISGSLARHAQGAGQGRRPTRSSRTRPAAQSCRSTARAHRGAAERELHMISVARAGVPLPGWHRRAAGRVRDDRQVGGLVLRLEHVEPDFRILVGVPLAGDLAAAGRRDGEHAVGANRPEVFGNFDRLARGPAQKCRRRPASCRRLPRPRFQGAAASRRATGSELRRRPDSPGGRHGEKRGCR